MVINGQWVMTEEEIERQQADALLECQKATRNRTHLLTTAEQMSKKFYRVAKLLQELKTSESFLSGPGVDLLQLPEMEYGEAQSLASVKALANAVILAQKLVSDCSRRAHELGVDG